jgi:hypothetical protein
MRRALFLGLATALLFSWALPASGHEGAQQSAKASAFSPQNAWMSMWMSAATPVSENVERVGGDNSFTGSHLVIQGNRMYVGWYGEGMRIYDISNLATPKLLGAWNPSDQPRADSVPDATTFNTPNGTRHIAVLGGTTRVSTRTAGPVVVEGTQVSEFLDVTDPANPKLLWKFVGAADGEAHNGDISDIYKIWLPSGGTINNGLRIYDMRPLLWENPGSPRRLFPPQSCRDAGATPTCDPVTLWENSPYRGNKPVGPAFTHTHDITIYEKYPLVRNGQTVRRDIILLAEGGNYTTANNGFGGTVFVIDVTNRSKPVVLQRWIHDHSQAGHERIQYGHEAQFLAGDRRLMLVTDEDLHNGSGCNETGGGAYAVRLTANLQNATELSEWFVPQGTPAAVCSVHVFSSLGKTVFFGAYNAGVQVVDYSDPANPQRIGQYIGDGATTWVAQYHKGFIFAGDMSRGLDVFKFTG